MKNLFNKEELYEIINAKYSSMKLNKQEGINSEWYEFIFGKNYEERLDREGLMEEFTNALNSAVKRIIEELKRLDVYSTTHGDREGKEEKIQQIKQSIMNKVTPILTDFLIA